MAKNKEYKEKTKDENVLTYSAKAFARFGELVDDGDITITVKRDSFKYKGDMLSCLSKLVQSVTEDRGNE